MSKTKIKKPIKEGEAPISGSIPQYLKDWIDARRAKIHGTVQQQLILILEEAYNNDTANHQS